MIKYAIKQRIVSKPEIQLPEGSLPVSVKHHDLITYYGSDLEVPECWQVIWLEPVK